MMKYSRFIITSIHTLIYLLGIDDHSLNKQYFIFYNLRNKKQFYSIQSIKWNSYFIFHVILYIIIIIIIIEKLPKISIQKCQDQYDTIFSNKQLWNFATHEDNSIRKAIYNLIKSLCLHNPGTLYINIFFTYFNDFIYYMYIIYVYFFFFQVLHIY